MAATPTTFRMAFPEFGDATKYADPRVQYQLDLALKLMNAGRWGELLDHGQQLFTAHQLSLQQRRIDAAASGATPGSSAGLISSKSVGPVSMSYDVSSIAEEDGGHWNMTIYGQQYLRLARQVGMGPIESGVSGELTSVSAYVGAWPGPNV